MAGMVVDHWVKPTVEGGTTCAHLVTHYRVGAAGDGAVFRLNNIAPRHCGAREIIESPDMRIRDAEEYI